MTVLVDPSPEGLLAGLEQALARVPHVDPLEQHRRVGGPLQGLRAGEGLRVWSVLERMVWPACVAEGGKGGCPPPSPPPPMLILPLAPPPTAPTVQVSKMYSWRDVAERTLRVYDDAAGSRRDDCMLARLARYMACGTWTGSVFATAAVLGHQYKLLLARLEGWWEADG
jgi:hypothetical protein